MRKNCFFYSLLLLSSLISSSSFADWGGRSNDYQTLEIGVGWRRDNLDWKVTDMEGGDSDYLTGVDSHIRFDDIDMYTISGKLRFLGCHYYVRLSGSYAHSYKGQAKEHFVIDNPCLFKCDTISIHTNNNIKRRSEFYDFNLAVGYPFLFCNCKLSLVPLIGYAYDRQRIRVSQEHDSSSSFSIDSSYNVFCSNPSSDPFDSSSSSEIASALGIHNHHDSASYRFSWYGPFAGIDLLYNLDNCWTLYGEFQGHFLNQVHRKRKSNTGVHFVDHYHHTGSAYGFDGNVGTCFLLCDEWYCNIDVDYKWWKGDSKHDKLEWDSIGVNVSLGVMF